MEYPIVRVTHYSDYAPMPKLLFGDSNARVVDGFFGMTDAFSHLTPRCDYDSRLRAGFLHKASFIEVNGVAINETYYNHMVAVSPVEKDNILLPVVGFHNGLWKSQKIVAQNNQGFFIPRNDRFEFETDPDGVSGGLIISFDLNRLKQIGQAMSGGIPFHINTDDVQPMRLIYKSVSLKKLFMLWIQKVDAFSCDSELLQLNGFDEQFYRLLAMAIKPELFFNAEIECQNSNKKPFFLTAFERYVDDNIESSVSLSEIESILKVSARTLQYACMKHYGCTPRTFIRNKKLEIAYERLTKKQDAIKISWLSAQLGFSSQSQFSRYFFDRYGVHPSKV